MTDTIIDAAQNVLTAQFKAQFSEAGFQCVGLGSTFAFEVKSDKFVQILHNDHNHWLTISSVGTTPGQTLVYNSMYPSAGQATKQQIASLMRVSELNLTLTFTDVQMHLPYARNKAGINDIVQPLQTMVPQKTLCKDT